MRSLRDTIKAILQGEIPWGRRRGFARGDLSGGFSNADSHRITIWQRPARMPGIFAVRADIRLPADFRDGPAPAFHAGSGVSISLRARVVSSPTA